MILVTGGTGFVGGPVVAALARRGAALRLLVHRRPATAASESAELVHADLTAPTSLFGVCTGVHTVLHLAAEVGDDVQRCTAVNVGGTRALVAEARRAGVRRIVYLSTAAVYGDAAPADGQSAARSAGHRGLLEDEVTPAPVSVTSRSRLIAEQTVRAAGGAALRPMFVYGPGDRWFIPTLAGALRRYPVSIDGGRARQSLVAVYDLAEAVAALIVDGSWRPGEVLHAAHPEPVPVAEITRVLVRLLGVPAPTGDVPFDQVSALLSGNQRLLHQAELIGRDHCYDGSKLWQRTGVRPAAFARRFAEYAGWYRAALAESVTERA